MFSALSTTDSNIATSSATRAAGVGSYAEFAAHWRPQIDAALAECTNLDADCPPNLAEAIRYSLLAPGKRLRPLLVLAAAKACGGDIAAAMPAACAVEMIHSYSLIHDDLPAMDDDDLRRGRPTNHKVYGEGIAILAGDALLTLAFETIARISLPRGAAQGCIAKCCSELARAAGACGMVGGQADDLAQEGKVPGVTLPAAPSAAENLALLEAIHRRKTGAMLNVSLRLGALVAGADTAQLDALAEYGARLGLTFQIMDDLLDVCGSQDTVGKRVGKDAARGKLTYPGLLGVEESRRRADRLTTEAIESLAPLGAEVEVLEDLARYVVERNH
jgi:geranylgeranyl diphosphate synthase type II